MPGLTLANVGFLGSSVKKVEFIAAVGTSDSSTLSLTSLNANAGDIIIFASASDNTQVTAPTGFAFTQEYTTDDEPYAAWGYFTYTNESSLTGLLSASDTAHIAICFRDVVTVSNAASLATGSGQPNPPSITVATPAMILALGFLDDDIITATAPTNYTLAISQNAGLSFQGVTVMAAYREITTGSSEDPGAFSGGNDQGVAATIGLQAY